MLELAAVTADRLVTDAETEAESLVAAAQASADAILEASRNEANQVAAELARTKEEQAAELDRERATALAELTRRRRPLRRRSPRFVRWRATTAARCDATSPSNSQCSMQPCPSRPLSSPADA